MMKNGSLSHPLSASSNILYCIACDPCDPSSSTPQGLEDVSSYPLLFAELMEEGWSMEELRKLAGLNLLRVLGAAERVAKELTASQVRCTMGNAGMKASVLKFVKIAFV